MARDKIRLPLPRFFAVLSSILLGGCSALDILDALVPHSGYVQHKNITYGDNLRQKLDIYVPEHLDAKVPVIVFFYGGSWKKGSKDDYRFVGQAFASKGYVTVIADYRLYPEVYFPTFMHDVARAFVWVHEHISEYGGDSKNLFVAGHSAGAYNAVMLTINDQYLRSAGGKRAWIKGTIGIAGPYDFLPFTDPDIIAIFSKSKNELTQPINHVGPNLPPMLLVTGDADDEVLPRNSINLAQKLQKNHDKVTTRIYPGVAHIGIVLALAKGFRDKAPVLGDVGQFVDELSSK